MGGEGRGKEGRGRQGRGKEEGEGERKREGEGPLTQTPGFVPVTACR